jgi:N-acetylglucosamine-6-phosphate deacetylase
MKQDGAISGWHYATREPILLRWQAGIITSIEPAATPPPADLWLAPSLVDLQVNGYGGVDFQRDEVTLEGLQSAIRQLQAAGCDRILLTLITDRWTDLSARLQRLRELRSQSRALQTAIVGWHVEGPFLSPEPGFHGAHNPSVMCDPTPAHIRELRNITGTDPLLITLAPERFGALDAIALAVSLGIKVSLGHTNASAEILRGAVQVGASGFTHLGNACPKELDRHDNILWRVFDTPGLTVGVIPDQIHVSPALFRLIHKSLALASIYYTTDAMAAAGAPPGRYTVGSLEVEVGPDQIVRLPGKTNFAGSALRPIDGVFRAVRMLNRPWQEVWDAFSVRPARFMGLTSELAAGQAASFCVVRTNGQNELVEIVRRSGVL